MSVITFYLFQVQLILQALIKQLSVDVSHDCQFLECLLTGGHGDTTLQSSSICIVDLFLTPLAPACDDVLCRKLEHVIFLMIYFLSGSSSMEWPEEFPDDQAFVELVVPAHSSELDFEQLVKDTEEKLKHNANRSVTKCQQI